MTDVLVIGAGPPSVLAALRAADLGAQTALVTSGAFGGMAANDGPVPVRTLAHAGRLMREASPSRQHTNLASRSAGKHTRRHKQLASVNRASQTASRNRPQQRERPINSRSLRNLTIEEN
jgi:pyruvate/2-oxoglutarate dehydrogenase complex dihydrolipoamide dehydrogenase (E3) component